MEFEPNKRLIRRRRLTRPLKHLAHAACRTVLRQRRPLEPFVPDGRVLVVALNRGVGDLLLASPAIRAVLDRFGTENVTVLARSKALAEWFGRLLEGAFVTSLDRFPSRRSLVVYLRQGRFDAAVDFGFCDRRSQVLARRSGAGVTVGIDTGRPTLYHRTVPVPFHTHAVEMWRRLARACGAADPPDGPRILLTAREQREAEAVLRAAGVGPRDVVAGLHPGARDDIGRMDKRWPVAAWVRLVRILSGRGVRCVVFGTEAEAERLAPLRSASRRLVWLVGRTSLAQAAAVVGRLKVLVGNNSALVHMAAALGVPTVSFGGGVFLPRWRPWGPKRLHRIMMASPTCDPAWCWECRWAGQACLSRIYPRDVARRVHEQLAAGSQQRTGPAAPTVNTVEAMA